MGHAFAEHLAALTDKRLWFDNPLAVRDARREFRRNRVFYAILTLCIALLVLLILCGRGLYFVIRFERHVPDWLGGNLATAIVIAISGVHFWWVARAAQRRVDGMLMREASLDSLTSLLMLPMSRLSLVLQAAAYPWMAAASVAILLLPIYMFCLGLEGITWTELFSLYSLFALASVAMPGFRRPALSGNVGATMLNQVIDNPNTEPDSGTTPIRKRGVKPGLGALTLIGIIPAGFVLFSLVAGFGRGQLYGSLANYVPNSILSLLPSSIISLPFMMARAMVTPFGFFQWSIIPLPVVVALVLLRKYLNLVRTSEFLSVGTYRDLAALPTYLPRRRAELVYRALFIIVTAGFVWPWAVRDNGLGFLTPNPTAADAGVFGFVFLALFTAAAWAVVRGGLLGAWMRPFSASEETRRTVNFGSSAWYLAAPFALTAVVTVLCLLFGGQFTISLHTKPMVMHILAISLGAVLMNIGLRRSTGQFGLAALLIPAAALWGPKLMHPLIYLSPVFGVVSQGPRNVFGLSNPAGPLYSAAPYWQWVVVDSAAGLLMFGAAQAMTLISLRRQVAKQPDSSEMDASEAVYDPTVLGSDVFADAGHHRQENLTQSDSPLSLYVVNAVGRCVDNAVVTRDLRGRLRNRLTASKVAYLFATVVVVSVIICLWLPFLAAPGSGFADGLYGTLPPYRMLSNGTALQTLANIQGCLYIALSISAFMCGYSVLPRAFGMDKRKNTLSFLLTTPMSAWSIVSGKAFALTLTCGAAFWFCAAASLLFCFPVALLSGGLVSFGWWAAVFGSAFLGYAATAMVMLALGSLFPNLTAVRYNGCIRLVVLYFVYLAASTLMTIAGVFGWALHFSPSSMWGAYIAIVVGLIALSLMITTGAVSGMRKGDIDLKMANR